MAERKGGGGGQAGYCKLQAKIGTIMHCYVYIYLQC